MNVKDRPMQMNPVIMNLALHGLSGVIGTLAQLAVVVVIVLDLETVKERENVPMDTQNKKDGVHLPIVRFIANGLSGRLAVILV